MYADLHALANSVFLELPGLVGYHALCGHLCGTGCGLPNLPVCGHPKTFTGKYTVTRARSRLGHFSNGKEM